MGKFKNVVFNFTNKTIKDKVYFEFEWDGDAEEIHYVKPLCPGCSTAFFKDGKVVGTLDLSRVGGQEGVARSVNKYIKVALDPNVPELDIQPNKIWRENPDKRKINLQLAGTLYK